MQDKIDKADARMREILSGDDSTKLVQYLRANPTSMVMAAAADRIERLEADRKRRGEPAFYVNARIFDPATGKIKTAGVNGALTWSEKPAGNWQVPVYTAPQSAESSRGEPVAFLCRECDEEGWSTYVVMPHEVPSTGEFLHVEPLYTAPLPPAPQPAEPVKVPSDDALDDALYNLEHDNYEQSYSGYKNRQADIALIRALLARYGNNKGESNG